MNQNSELAKIIEAALIVQLYLQAPEPPPLRRIDTAPIPRPEFSIADAQNLKRDHKPLFVNVKPSEIQDYVLPNSFSYLGKKVRYFSTDQQKVLDPIRSDMHKLSAQFQAQSAKLSTDSQAHRDAWKMQWAKGILRQAKEVL